MRIRINLKKREKIDKQLVKVDEVLPKDSLLIDKNPFGALFVRDGSLLLMPFKEHEVWGSLAPIFFSSKVEEAWIFSDKAIITVSGIGRMQLYPKSADYKIEDLISRVIAQPGVNVSFRNPRGVTDYGDWRIAIQLQSGGQLHMVATRIKRVPSLVDILPANVGVKLLLLILRPSTVLITGPPGSGKTTLLSSIVEALGQLFPWLHIAIVEKYRELNFQGGWLSHVVTEELADGVRYSMRYLRPDILVVGEIMAEDFWSLLEPSRAGIPTLTTFHAPTVEKAIKTLSDALQLHLKGASNILTYLDVLISTRKIITIEGVKRCVNAIYISDGQRLTPTYIEGQEVDQDTLEKALPETLYIGETKEVEETLQAYFRANAKLAGEPGKLAVSNLEA
jgi:flagellar protein FlaI